MSPRQDSQRAFEAALLSGRLSLDKTAANYVGRFMYMGPAVDGGDSFKDILTRQYLA